jgi:signal peptidase I
MPPTVLLADPVVRLAGARLGVRGRRGARIAANRRVSRGWLALAAVLAVAFVGMGYLGTWPPLATVMSASMEPTIKTGDIVVLKKLDRAPRVGDVVAVSVPPSIRTRFGYPPVIIHRIIGIDADGVVTTKGDAFKDPDPFDVPSSALDTTVVATLPAAGRVFAFLGSTLGLLWLAGGALLLIGMPLLDRYRDGQRRGLDERDEVCTVLQAVTEELTVLRAERLEEREQLLQQIERAIATAVAARVPAPPPRVPPLPPRGPGGCVPASQWRPPTPDVMSILRPGRSPSEIFSLPADFTPALTT